MNVCAHLSDVFTAAIACVYIWQLKVEGQLQAFVCGGKKWLLTLRTSITHRGVTEE